MTEANCSECGNSWTLKKDPSDYTDGPKCSECGSYQVDVEGQRDFSDVLGESQSKRRRLKETLEGVPGVGDKSVEYVLGYFDTFEGQMNPGRLRQLLLQLNEVDSFSADMVVQQVYGQQDGHAPSAAGTVPSDPSGPADEQRAAEPPEKPAESDGGESALDAVVKMKEAGLLGDGGDENDALAEALETMGQQIGRGNQMVAQALESDSGGGLTRQDIEEIIVEQQKEDKTDRLEEKLEDLQTGGEDADPEVEQVRKNSEVQLKSLEVMQDTVNRMPEKVSESLENAILPLLDRYAPPEETVHRQLWEPPQREGRPEMDYDPDSPEAQEQIREMQKRRVQNRRKSPQKQAPTNGHSPSELSHGERSPGESSVEADGGESDVSERAGELLDKLDDGEEA
jgi:hypothetical protein